MQALRLQHQRPLCAGLSVRPSAPSCRSVAVHATVECTRENQGGLQSYYPKLVDTLAIEKDWVIIDAEGQKLGRLACLVAKFIRGKHRAIYTPSMDMGAYVIVINPEKVIMTGNKMTQKVYRRHGNGVVGSMKTEAFLDLRNRIPERIIEKAVWGMLPKGRLGRRIKHHLKVYKGSQHPHDAQKPMDVTHLIDGKF